MPWGVHPFGANVALEACYLPLQVPDSGVPPGFSTPGLEFLWRCHFFNTQGYFLFTSDQVNSNGKVITDKNLTKTPGLCSVVSVPCPSQTLSRDVCVEQWL